MSDWYGSARTYYFRVKDETKFRKWAESIGGLEVVTDKEGRISLLSHGEYGGWPTREMEEDEEFNLFQEMADHLVKEVANHLQEKSVAVFVEVGAEKLCYLTGHAACRQLQRTN